MNRKKISLITLVVMLVSIACGATAPREKDISAAEVDGQQLFQQSGCNGCHNGPAGVAPSLEGVYGTAVTLENGETVTADEAYIRESILSPKARVVSGYEPIMPGFENELTTEQVEALVKYVRSLTAGE